MRVQGLIELLKNSQIFGFLDDDAIDDVVNEFSLEYYSHGEQITHKGDSQKNFFIIFSGNADVVIKDGARTKRVASLKKGDFFGEEAILHDKPTSSTICAMGDVVVAKLAGEDFKKLAESKKEFANFVKAYSANQALTAFLKNFGSFGALSAKESAKWLTGLNYEEPKNNGEIIFAEGDEGDKFYIVASGGVEIVKNINGVETLLVTLGEGKFFGEMALMSNAPRAATAKSVGVTHLVSMDKDKFTAMVEANPALSGKIRNIVDMYKTSGIPRDAFLQTIADKKDEYKISAEEIKEHAKSKEFALHKAGNTLGSYSASLTMIASYYGKKVDGQKAMEYIKNEELESVANAFLDLAQLKATATKVDINDLVRVKIPFVAKLDNASVVVYAKDGSNFKIAHPLEGLIELDKASFLERFAKEVVIIDAPSPAGLDENKITFYSFLGILLPYKQVLLEILGASLFLSLLSLLPPLFVRILIDDVIVQRNESMLAVLVASLIIVAIFTGALNALRSYLQFYLSGKLQVAILGRFYRHLISLPLSYFFNRQVGSILSDFGDGRDAEKSMTKIVLTVIVDGSMALAFLLAMLFADTKLFLVFIGFVFVMGSLIFAYTYFVRQYMPRTLSRDVKVDNHMIENIENISALKAFRMENHSRNRWETMFINKLGNANKYITINSISGSAVTAMRTLTTAVLLGYASMLALSNEISIGQALSFNMIAMLALVPIGNMIQLYNEINSAEFFSSGLNKVYSIEPEGGKDDKQKPDLNIKNAVVEFKNVSFGYGNSKKNVLSNFCLTMEHGKCTAVIGRIGSGKSTIINLLTRITEPRNGKITIDGIDISQVNLNSIRSHIGVVFQDTNIFSGTIQSNIGFGTPNATLAQIIEAATLVGAHEFITAMSDGYETTVGEKGIGLSGGQKRLIAIARALVSNPPILIMDEPTNDLDAETEQIFKENLKIIGFGRTMIIITHRSTLIRDADKIALLEEGEIVEAGTHSELIAARGHYFYLCAKQIALS